MKKSLLISFDFPPVKGGISHNLWQVCSLFPQDKILVLTQDLDNHNPEKFKVIRKNISGKKMLVWPKWLPVLFYCFGIIRKEKIELIQAGQLLPIGTIAMVIKKILNIPYIVYIYGQDLVIMRDNARKMRLIKSVLANSQNIIACSHYSKKLAMDLGVPDNKIKVVYPCINKDIGDVPENEISEFKKRYYLDNFKIILSVGNLVKRKGVDMVIKSLPKVIKIIPEIKLLIAGIGSEKGNYEKNINELNLKNNVVFLDRVSEQRLNLLYKICNLLIMPSREIKNKKNEIIDVEGFGMVFLEANLRGKPVIGGKSGGVPEAIEHEKSGLLVNPEDTEDIAEAIIKLLSNPKLSKKLGEYGKQRVLNDFRCDAEVRKIKQLLI